MNNKKESGAVISQRHKGERNYLQLTSQVERLLAEPLSLAVIDQITNEGWVEGWHMEEEEVEVEQGKENGIGKVEQGNKETGGKKEELGRIPLSTSR